MYIELNHFDCFYFRGSSPGVALVRKLIAVFESLEKLPVYSYDLNGSGGYGLQVTLALLLI